MKQLTAVKILESTPLHRTKSEKNQILRCLFRINDAFKEQHRRRLFSFWDIVDVCNAEDPHAYLSYVISNIEELTREVHYEL